MLIQLFPKNAGFNSIQLPDEEEDVTAFEDPHLIFFLSTSTEHNEYFINFKENHKSLIFSDVPSQTGFKKIKVTGADLFKIAEYLKKEQSSYDVNQIEDLQKKLYRYEKLINEYQIAKQNFKFEEIQVTEDQDPKNKPKISLKLDKNHLDFLKKNKDFNFKFLNYKTTLGNDYNTYEFTGKRSVLHVIDTIEKLESKLPPNLEASRKAIKDRIKKVEKLPARALLFEDLKEIGSSNIKATHEIKKFQDKDGKITYFLKMNPVDRKLPELEAAVSWYFKLMLGDKAAAARCVYNKNHERVGTASEQIEHFLTFHEYYDSEISRSLEQLVDGGLGGICAISHILQDDDLNFNNIGMSGKLVCRTDYDRTLHKNITPKYFSWDPNSKRTNIPGQPTFTKSFPITARDIQNQPILTDAKPSRSPLDWLLYLKINPKKLAENPKFIRDKYKHYIKSVLVPKNMLEAIAAAHIISDKGQKQFVDTISKINEQFYGELLTIPEVQQLVASDDNLLTEITNEFKVYNENCDNCSQSPLKIDTSIIEKNYNNFKNQLQLRNTLLEIIKKIRLLNGNEKQEEFKEILKGMQDLYEKIRNYYSNQGIDVSTKNNNFDLYIDFLKGNGNISHDDFKRLNIFAKALRCDGIRSENFPNAIAMFDLLLSVKEKVDGQAYSMDGENKVFSKNINIKNNAAAVVKDLTKQIKDKLDLDSEKIKDTFDREQAIQFKETVVRLRNKIQDETEEKLRNDIPLTDISKSSIPHLVKTTAQLVDNVTSAEKSKKEKLRCIRGYRKNALILSGIQKLKVAIRTVIGAAIGLVAGPAAGAGFGAAIGGLAGAASSGIGVVPGVAIGGAIGTLGGAVAGPAVGGFIAMEKGIEHYQQLDPNYEAVQNIANKAASFVSKEKVELEKLIKDIDDVIGKLPAEEVKTSKSAVITFFWPTPKEKILKELMNIKKRLTAISFNFLTKEDVEKETKLVKNKVEQLQKTFSTKSKNVEPIPNPEAAANHPQFAN